MEDFIIKTLRKIRKEAPRRLRELRTVCDELVDVLSKKTPEELAADGDADKYFDILQAACESKTPRLMEIGLDSIHFLIERGYLRGIKRIEAEKTETIKGGDADDKPSGRRTLMDLIVEVIAKCSEEYDDNVHLQVIKALLMALTSQYCQVHEASLLLAVRACFHIHLITKSQVNKTTAKAALTQMLSIVFQRMEAFDARAKVEMEATLAALNRIEEESVAENKKNDSIITSMPPCGSCMYAETFSGLKYTPGGPNAIPFEGFSEFSVESAPGVSQQSFPSIIHKDAFLIFRALCKLSMKGLNEDAGTSQDPIALQNKILSLELILHIMQRGGPAFRSGDKFVYAIKQYLCVSLLGNCTSPIAQVTSLSLQIFVSLLNNFKEHLKGELEIFVGNIFLKLLESEYSTFEHKIRVLEVLHNICMEPAALVELFINYDCDFEGNDLFRRIVDSFSKIAKNPVLGRNTVDFMSSKKVQSDEHTLRQMALQGLVIILKSILRSTSFGMVGEAAAAAAAVASNRAVVSNNADAEGNDEDEKYTQKEEKVKEDVSGLVDNYNSKQRTNEEIETGILKFNLSPKKGLAYLVSKGHIDMTPNAVALFLRTYQDKLDKTQVGEYLGKEQQYEGGFCIKVLHEYVDSMGFTNMHFDEAIRFFLSGFRIPGESQKIDRMMEKFAERYYLQNRGVFASADMAFILAFSTIMLQTNLHNPAIRDDKRMTKEQFIRQNKGISSDGELPDDMLMDIYDRIAASPISLAQDEKEKQRKARKEEPSSFLAFPISTDKRRKDAYNDERKEIVKVGEALFRQNKRSKKASSAFVRAAQSDENYVRPMFESAWPQLLSVFSQNFELLDDEDVVDLCLEGFLYAIRLAARLDVGTARETYINALAKFTALESMKEMKPKNISAIKILMRISVLEGDVMFESWGQILKSFSQLVRLEAMSEGGQSDDIFLSESEKGDSRGMKGRYQGGRRASATSSYGTADQISKFFTTPSRAEANRIIDEANAELVKKDIDSVMIDRIFLDSQAQSSESILHFVRALCAVSLLEISPNNSGEFRGRNPGEEAPPRVFALQKIVEVADTNMQCRPRITWTNMWSILAMHFTTCGIHDNHAVAMYAIDSLKQLSIKFLQKVELTNFNFQRLFLKPFETIMAKSKANEIKELILRCLDIMIKACAPNIRSGWRSIFAVFSVAAYSESREIAGIAFEVTERLTTQHFNLLIFDFVELMNCLVSFVAGPHTLLSLAALSHLAQCADHLARGVVQPALDAQNTSSDTLGISWENSRPSDISDGSEQDVASHVFRLWWPLLLGLSTTVSDHRVEVRNRALEVLHQVLEVHGTLFTIQTWEFIFRGVLIPMIDSAKTDLAPQPQSSWPAQKPQGSKDSNSWIATTAAEALNVCVELFHHFRPLGLTVVLLHDILGMLESCINQDVETLSLMGLKAFTNFVLSYDLNSMDTTTRNLICERLCNCLLKNLCLDFGDCGIVELDNDATADVRRVLYDCPVASRRRFKDSDSEIGNELVTPYGTGKVTHILGPDERLNVASRRVIQLSFGILYSRDKFSFATAITTPRTISNALKKTENVWSSLGTSAMTSMVLMLDYVGRMAEIINAQYERWTLENLADMLRCIEAGYHHARCFNNDVELRVKLHNKGFMHFKDNLYKLPHLLEQETSCLLNILTIAFRLCAEEGGAHSDANQRASFAELILIRISAMSFESYIEIDEAIDRKEGLRDSFLFEKLNAHKPSVLIILKGFLGMTSVQVRRNFYWIGPMLSNIVVVNDRAIRQNVKSVLELHVNPVMNDLSIS